MKNYCQWQCYTGFYEINLQKFIKEIAMPKHRLGKRNGDLMATVETNLQPRVMTPTIVASIFDGAIFINMLKSDASNNTLNDDALKSFVIPSSQRSRPVG